MRGLEKTHLESSAVREPHALPVTPPPQGYLGFKGLWLTQGRNGGTSKAWAGREGPACPAAEAWVKGERTSQKPHWSWCCWPLCSLPGRLPWSPHASPTHSVRLGPGAQPKLPPLIQIPVYVKSCYHGNVLGTGRGWRGQQQGGSPSCRDTFHSRGASIGWGCIWGGVLEVLAP